MRAIVVSLALTAATCTTVGLNQTAETAREARAPEFPSQNPEHWVGPPQSVSTLKGQVFILDVWTFG